MNELRILAGANAARQLEWDPQNKVTLIYRSNELAGETGEVCNVLKKIERERLGIRGRRATVEQAAEELADVVICTSLLANELKIDLWSAIVQKFNKTSAAVGLATSLDYEHSGSLAGALTHLLHELAANNPHDADLGACIRELARKERVR